MTVFLWHLTAFVLVMTVDWLLLGGWGLGPVPGTGEWWITRPIWIAVYIFALLPMIGIFARHELSFGPIRGGRTVPRLRAVLGVLAICAGLGATAGLTIASPVLVPDSKDDREKVQFERIIAGLAKQLRSSLERKLGRYSVDLPVFPGN